MAQNKSLNAAAAAVALSSNDTPDTPLLSLDRENREFSTWHPAENLKRNKNDDQETGQSWLTSRPCLSICPAARYLLLKKWK